MFALLNSLEEDSITGPPVWDYNCKNVGDKYIEMFGDGIYKRATAILSQNKEAEVLLETIKDYYEDK